MSLQSLVTRELLFAYFAGQATVLQKQMIEKWVEEKPGNEEFFYACLHEWETLHPQYRVNTDAAIDKFNEGILSQSRYSLQPEVGQRGQLKSEKAGGWRKWLVAASVLCVLQFGAWLLRDAVLYKSYATGYGETNLVSLPDGSSVLLNANSVLQVPRFNLGEFSRHVHLRGEARFSVVHTPDDKKFVVQTDSAFEVEVLGTEFNLSARKSGTRVVLQKGQVRVLYKKEEELAATALVMAPGDLVTVDNKQKRLQVTQVSSPENFSAWQHGRFVFDNTSLYEIKEMLHDNYGLTVELGGIDVSEMKVSGSFKANNADELLQALSEVLGVNVMRQDKHVLFTGNK
ncbi:FecR domain-containing protein [Pontibacter saemangeumensis]|uniref:FecR domain-containing protein n=1 Tax=Pontibacter saemangeumensis TaxID=1084525 RepID=A0ABP8M238_9BACT